MSKLAKALTAAAGNAGESLYVEDVFSTYLYDGTGSAQTITNGIDLNGEGGLVWIKDRDIAFNHTLVDTERGATKLLVSNSTAAEATQSNSLTSFNSNGFTVGAGSIVNYLDSSVASWTFRKAEKFFDVVTYTGDGTVRQIPHNLGSTPAVIIVKCTSHTNNWYVYTASTGATKSLFLDTTSAATTRPDWGNTAPTDSVFTVDGTTVTATNYSGRTYVAYLFASDAGGFGDDGSENIIKCGVYTGTGSAGNFQDLGFEPQWVLTKPTTGSNSWVILDVMRGMNDSQAFALKPDSSVAENQDTPGRLVPRANGFEFLTGAYNNSGVPYIYIAIRRPMKTPESGTEVFSTVARTATGATYTYSGNDFPIDMVMQRQRSVLNTVDQANIFDRLRGATKSLSTAQTQAEETNSGITGFDYQDGYVAAFGSWSAMNWVIGSTEVYWNFKRATGFFDVVAYTGDGAASQTLNHNLGVTPDIIVVKKRSTSGSQWPIIITSTTDTMYLNTTNASFGAFYYIDNPTSTTFDVQTDGSAPQSNQSGETYIAYLFATLDGVSKVGSYTGTGSNVDVDCGFAAGARFVLIKRTDSTGDWYVWDSVRGIVAGNDPYLLLNSTAAEVTSTDYIDPLASGFTVTSSAPAALNAIGGSYIFLAIA